MKRLTVLLALAMLAPVGCKQTTPAPPLAPGYVNSTDQQLGEIVASAHSFYVTVQNDISTGKYVPNPTEKTALNDFGVALNAAQTVYLAYHNNPTAANLQAAQTTVANLQNQMNTVQAQVTSEVK